MTSLAEPAGDVTAGVAFREECEVPSGSVSDYDDIMKMDQTILTMIIWVLII